MEAWSLPSLSGIPLSLMSVGVWERQFSHLLPHLEHLPESFEMIVANALDQNTVSPTQADTAKRITDVINARHRLSYMK